MTADWTKMSAAAQGRAIAAGQIDPVALTDAYLATIETHPFAARIYSQITAERARAEAKAARTRAKAGTLLGPMDGVPVSWKDIVDSAGVRTEAGSQLLEWRVPEHDALVLKRAGAAGAVCLGKTHTSELAFSALGYNPKAATPPNVHDPDLAPGGSSSGAAPSVAFDLAAAGIGSDTGGSVRIPAAWNDVVGLKPTWDVVSLDGVVPLCPLFDTIGPLTRTVEDAALLLDMLTGAVRADHSPVDLRQSRIAVLETTVFEDIEAAPAQGFETALHRLQGAGVKVERLTTPLVPAAIALTGVLISTEAYATWGETIEAAPDKMFHQVRTRFRGGRDYTAVEYARAWQDLRCLRREWMDLTADYDAVVLPTSPILPPNVAQLAGDRTFYAERNTQASRNTRIANLLGLSALSLPTGVPSCGFMVMGRPNGDTALLRLGVAIETALRAG